MKRKVVRGEQGYRLPQYEVRIISKKSRRQFGGFLITYFPNKGGSMSVRSITLKGSMLTAKRGFGVTSQNKVVSYIRDNAETVAQHTFHSLVITGIVLGYVLLTFLATESMKTPSYEIQTRDYIIIQAISE